MTIDVRLPDLGDDAVAEVSISAWLAEVGETLTEGADLLEITTDKAAFCVPCPQAGVLKETKVRPGDEIRVGEVICALEI